MRQFDELRDGALDDWHPPVMARVWQACLALGAHGTAPLFALQTLLFFGGLALVFNALPRVRPAVVAAAVLALVIPAGWLTVVVKDAQMVAALVAATGLVASFVLRGQRLPRWGVAAVAVLLTYAVLLRANAAFAVVPLVLAWAGWFGARHVAARGALLLAATLAVLGISPLVNHRLLGAAPSHVERTLPLFDLAGIAHFGGPPPPRVPAAAWARAEALHCYSPVQWDALGDDRRCGFVGNAVGLQGANGSGVIGEWARVIAAAPLAYARHRLAHLDATLRFVVPFGQPAAAAPPDSQPNAERFGGGGTWRTRGPAWIGRALAATPLGWPAAWLAASLGLWATAADTPRSAERALALALFVSATCATLSFAVVGIASDLRYHLWAMVATTLGGVLLSTVPGVPRQRLAATLAAVAIVAAIGTGARMILPAGVWQ